MEKVREICEYVTKQRQEGRTVTVDLNHRDRVGKATALHVAALGGHSECVRELLTHGADPGVQDGEGWTVVHRAALWRDSECLSLLFTYNADVNVTNKDGDTALDLAERHNNPSCAALLRQSSSLNVTKDNSDVDLVQQVSHVGHHVDTANNQVSCS